MRKFLLAGVCVLLFGGLYVSAQEIEVAATLAFTEGPTVNRDGTLFFSDLANNSIMRLSTDGRISTFRHPSNYSNGLIFDAQWRLLACESGDSTAGTPPRITRTDLVTGRIEILIDKYEGKLLNAPNDITIDGKGRIYFSDRPSTLPNHLPTRVDPKEVAPIGVYRIDTDGTITRLLAPPDTEMPNGLIVSPDDKIFYLIESSAIDKGLRMIRAYDLKPDGSLTNMRIFHNFYPGRSGDGMSIDTQGNLYVAAGLNTLRKTSETLDTKAGIHVFSPAGALLKFIPIPEDLITNCAFGGPDLKMLYITAGKTIFRVRTEIEGTRR